MESIPEVLGDKDNATDQSDSASIHDMDYVNPRGVRFTQSTQRDGKTIPGFYFSHLFLDLFPVLFLYCFVPLLTCMKRLCLLLFSLQERPSSLMACHV